MDNDTAARYEDVTFSYTKGEEIIDGMDLSLNKDDFVTIIGQNGSGKSTLVKHLNGLLIPDSGRVLIHDESNNIYSTTEKNMEKLSNLVGYVFQNPDDQIFHSTVYDEVMYGLQTMELSEDEKESRVEKVLEDVHLSNLDLNENPFRLSKGQRQRIAIAGVLVMEPQIICVDEPTTGQDRTEARRIMDIFQEYNDRGTTIVMVTHDMTLAAEYTDRVIVLKDGSVIADGSPESVFSKEENLMKTNVRPPQITQLGARLERANYLDLEDDMWLKTEDAYMQLSKQLIEDRSNVVDW